MLVIEFSLGTALGNAPKSCIFRESLLILDLSLQSHVVFCTLIVNTSTQPDF